MAHMMDVDITIPVAAAALPAASEPSCTADNSGVVPMIAAVEVPAEAAAGDGDDGRDESRYMFDCILSNGSCVCMCMVRPRIVPSVHLIVMMTSMFFCLLPSNGEQLYDKQRQS